MPENAPPASSALEAALARLRPGFDLLELPACVIDQELRYRYVNAAYAENFEMAREDMVGRKLSDIFANLSDDARRRALSQALSGESVILDRQTRNGPNTGRWVRAHYMPVRGEREVLAAAVVLVHIQHLKDAEAAIAARERQLALITDTVGFPVTYIDTRGIVRFANAHSAKWAGLEPGTMVGRTMEEMTPPAIAAQTMPLLRQALAGEALTYEREAMWPGRENRRVRGHMIPDRDESGAMRGVLVLLMDIEDDYRLRQSLVARTRELQIIMDNVGVPMAYIGADRRFRFVNAPGPDWPSELNADNVVGRRIDEVYPAPVLATVAPMLDRAFGGEKVSYERLGRNGRGELRWVRVRLMPDVVDGKVQGIFSVMIDIDDDKRLREALEEQGRQLRLYTDNIPVSVAYLDRDRRYVFVNKTFADVRGKRIEDVIGRTSAEVLGQAASDELADMSRRVLSGETATYERQMTLPSGEKRWILGRAVPDFGPDGAVRGMYVVGHDVQELKDAQEQLRAHEEELRFFAENIPEAIVYIDNGRGCTFVNNLFLTTRGFTREFLLGKFPKDVYGPEEMRLLQPGFDRVAAGEEVVYEREVRNATTGEIRWVRVRLTPRKDAAGRVLGFYVVSTDVHDLMLAEEQVRAREEELRFFAENIPEAILYIDRERGCTFVNNVFLATRGMTREEALGKFPKDVYSADLVRSLQPYIDRALAGEEVLYERELELPGGRKRWVRVRLSPRKDGAGRVAGYYVVSNDIHDLKLAQEAIAEKERDLRQVMDSIPTPLVYVDENERYRYANDAFLSAVGLPAGKVVGHTIREVLGEERYGQLGPILARLAQSEVVNQDRLVAFADGQRRWMNLRYTPRHDGGGRMLGHYVSTVDIHERKLVEEELRRTNSILSAHFDNTPLAVIEWDPQHRVVRWTGAAESIFGWSADEVLGKEMGGLRLVYEDDIAQANEVSRRLREGRQARATLLNRNYRKDGSVIWVEWHNSALRNAEGELVSVLSLAQDVSSRIQAEERLQFMATHDGLTGLPNRLLLNDRLTSAISRAQRSGGGVAVLFLDLDHFKDVNDTLGHRVGDALLKDLSRRIRGTLRQSDLLVRISGDEFVIVLEDLSGDSGPDRVAQKVLDDVLRPFRIEGHEVQVSGSLGYAVYPADGTDPETLLKNADAAMYHAKELGRNSYRAFSAALAQRRDQRLGLEAALRRAIRNEEFELHYQPIIDVVTGRVSHAEALLRWNDPARGTVLPAAFIPVAEEAGLMRDLGQWVFRQAARQAAAWNREGAGPGAVAVNLSASQLRDSAIVAEFEASLKEAGCAPSWLTLEITETSMVRDIEGVGVTLRKLRRLGFRIAIDDFGTGFSSLSHLRHLPVDSLKIDKSFVADINGGSRRAAESGGAAIVAAVTGLARGLGLEVVAEGVERQTQLEFLREQGCASFQGYLACPPMPVAQFERWLRDQGLAPGAAPRPARGKAKAKAIPKTKAAPKSKATAKAGTGAKAGPKPRPAPRGKRLTRK